MEAKDTVMSLKQQAKIWLEIEQKGGFLLACDVKGVLTDLNLFNDIEQGHSQAIAEGQAEISFKAGQEAERQRVLEYLQNLATSHPKISLGEVLELIEVSRPGSSQRG